MTGAHRRFDVVGLEAEGGVADRTLRVTPPTDGRMRGMPSAPTS